MLKYINARNVKGNVRQCRRVNEPRIYGIYWREMLSDCYAENAKL